MKKLLLLILVSCFCFGLKAQADSGQPFSVFSNGDESYDVTYNTNFVDVYFANGLHYLLVYWIHIQGVKGGTSRMECKLRDQRYVSVHFTPPISHCVIECEDGENPVFYFQKMFDVLGTESNPVERVYVKFNAL